MSVMDWRAAAAKRGLVVTDLAEHVGTEIGGSSSATTTMRR